MPQTPLPRPPTARDADRQPSHGERVAAELRDEILRGRFRAGERLPSERDLALRFAVHRGAVREALKKLEQLGLAEIRPGGARVSPLEQASLDVVEHLIDLEDPPDPQLVDQVLQVLGGLFAMAARIGVERANETQRGRAAALLASFGEPGLEPQERYARLDQLGDLFVDASANLVLRLVMHGLKTSQILDRLQRGRERRGLQQPPMPAPLLKRIERAVLDGDGASASNLLNELTSGFRRFARETLEAERAELHWRKT